MALIQEYNKLYEQNSNIKKIYVNGNRVWPVKIKDYTEPFYVENISNNAETLNIVKYNENAPTLEIEYSTDKTTWQTFGTTSTTALTMTLQPSEKIYLRCNTDKWASSTPKSNRITGISKVGGNIMSLLYGSNFTGQERNFPDATLTYVLCAKFNGNTNLVDASDLLLPANTLASNCYSSMFYGCTSLTTAPALPATTLASNCYNQMFRGCTSLTTAPALPATTLAGNCYYSMFYDCTSLTTAPSSLPANTLASNCYSSMFDGCTSLTTSPVLHATTLADYCYSSMFRGCTSLTTAPSSLPATTLAGNCYYSMFYGCTSLTTAPALPATTLATSCYNQMFRGCTSLTTAPALPATTLAGNCYYSMFYDCTSLTTAPALPATTLTTNCYNSMFRGCTSLTTAPALPAKNLLAASCYSQMFHSCRMLNKIKCLATRITSISGNSATTNWLLNVSSTGIFTKATGVTWPTGVSGIPSGWTVVEE